MGSCTSYSELKIAYYCTYLVIPTYQSQSSEKLIPSSCVVYQWRQELLISSSCLKVQAMNQVFSNPIVHFVGAGCKQRASNHKQNSTGLMKEILSTLKWGKLISMIVIFWSQASCRQKHWGTCSKSNMYCFLGTLLVRQPVLNKTKQQTKAAGFT